MLCQALPPNQHLPEPQGPDSSARIYAASTRPSHGLGPDPERLSPPDPLGRAGSVLQPLGSLDPGGRRRLHPGRVPSRATLTSWEYAGVHEGGHAEVGQHEEKDNGIVGRNDGGDVQAEPRAPAGTGAVGYAAAGHPDMVPAPAQPRQCHRAPRCPREPAQHTGVVWLGSLHSQLRVRSPAQGLCPFSATKSSPRPQPVPSTPKPERHLHQPDPGCAQPPSQLSLRWDVLQETIAHHHHHPWPRCCSKGIVTIPLLGWGQRASPQGATVIP